MPSSGCWGDWEGTPDPGFFQGPNWPSGLGRCRPLSALGVLDPHTPVDGELDWGSQTSFDPRKSLRQKWY